MTTTRWTAPEAVDPPTTETVTSLYRRVSEAVGLRGAGWICLGLGVVGIVVGLAAGWLEFAVTGVVAVVMVGIALLFTIGKPRLAVALDVAQRAVVVGDRANGLVRITAESRHLGSRLDLPVGADVASVWLPAMAAGAIHDHRFRIPTRRRGRIVVGPATSLQGDPFALAGRETHWTGELEVFVHPRTVRLPGRQLGFVHDLEGHASPHLSAADMNFHALRPYVPGDDRRHVHWKSSARAGELMVRQFEESRMSRVLVALDTGRTSYIDEEEFELAVSVAGSLARQALLGESVLSLVTTRDEIRALSPTMALDGLSLVEQTARGGIQDLAQSSSERDPGASIALLVTGSTASMADVRMASARFDVDTRFVGTRVSLGEELRTRSAGNVTVNQVGALEDLPRAMRRAMA